MKKLLSIAIIIGIFSSVVSTGVLVIEQGSMSPISNEI